MRGALGASSAVTRFRAARSRPACDCTIVKEAGQQSTVQLGERREHLPVADQSGKHVDRGAENFGREIGAATIASGGILAAVIFACTAIASLTDP